MGHALTDSGWETNITTPKIAKSDFIHQIVNTSLNFDHWELQQRGASEAQYARAVAALENIRDASGKVETSKGFGNDNISSYFRTNRKSVRKNST